MRLISHSLTGFLALFLAASVCIASPTAQPAFKRYLTKIDATGTTGLCFILGNNTLALKNLQGQRATSFTVESSTVKVTPTVTVSSKSSNGTRVYQSAKQTWQLTDESGEGVVVTNNTTSTLIVVSMIDRTIVVTLAGEQYNVPGHSFLLINNPLAPGKLVLGSQWTAYYGSITEKLPDINSPTLIQIEPNEAGIENGVPVISETRIFGPSLTLGGS